jgi:uncharacterized RDD family membrane protein YckC
MMPAARKPILLSPVPAVVWLALCIASTATLRPAHAAPPPPPATAPATSPAPARTSAPAGRELLAFGTEQRFWSADVIPYAQGKTSGTKTFLRVRGPGDPQWRIIGELEAPALSLAHRGNELLVVLDGGDWRIVSDSGARSGNALPGSAKVLALAGDGDDVWAVGVGPVTPTAPPAATTSTATTTTTSASATTTAAATARAATTAPSAGEQISLYQLTHGDWTRRDAIPAELKRDDLRVVSLAVLDRKLMLALIDSAGVVRLFTRQPDGGWDRGQEIAPATAGNTRLRLLDLRGKPALWVSDPTGPGALYIAAKPGERWQGPVRLAPSPKLQNFDRTALATALGQLRLLASDGKQRLAEQIYNEDGSLSGPATEAVTAPSPLDNRVAQLLQMFVVAVLFIWMMGALRQRPDSQEAAKRVEQLNLAPIGRRALGGAIDLLPVLIALYVATQFAPPPDPAGPSLSYDSPQVAWIAAGIAIYLLHTTAMELLFARSLGKFATGTRVAALDGTRPATLALLTRNLLRIVDLVFLLFPVIFVFFSPLRQRVGDMAAGTLVVMATPEEPARDDDDSGRDDAPPKPPPSGQ